jgi:hypothetical protein
MIPPIAIEYILKAFPEERVFPSLDGSSINMGRVKIEVPLRTCFSDPKSICVGQRSI